MSLLTPPHDSAPIRRSAGLRALTAMVLVAIALSGTGGLKGLCGELPPNPAEESPVDPREVLAESLGTESIDREGDCEHEFDPSAACSGAGHRRGHRDPEFCAAPRFPKQATFQTAPKQSPPEVS